MSQVYTADMPLRNSERLLGDLLKYGAARNDTFVFFSFSFSGEACAKRSHPLSLQES
jgi:hypothetical protein